MDHTTAQWIHDVSAVTTKAQLAGSTRSHDRHPNDDVDVVGSTFSISPRNPQSQISMRDLTPDGSESSCPLNEADSSPVDEVDLDEAEACSEAESSPLESDGPDYLDQPWEYTFRRRDKVWIRTEEGNWYQGEVSSNNIKRGKTRQQEGLVFYPVIFRIGFRIRKHFAPLNGEIKPDTPRIRTLLRQSGWLL